MTKASQIGSFRMSGMLAWRALLFSVPIMVPRPAEGQVDKRDMVYKALQRVDSGTGEPLQAELQAAIAILQSNEPGYESTALALLSAAGRRAQPAIPVLFDICQRHGSPTIRRDAVHVLVRVAGITEEVRQLIVTLAQDDARPVRVAACRELIASDGTAPAFAAVIEEIGKSARRREAAAGVDALIMAGGAAVAHCIAAYGRSDDVARAVLVEICGEIGEADQTLVEFLSTAASTDGSPAVRRRARWALGNCGALGSRALTALLRDDADLPWTLHGLRRAGAVSAPAIRDALPGLEPPLRERVLSILSNVQRDSCQGWSSWITRDGLAYSTSLCPSIVAEGEALTIRKRVLNIGDEPVAVVRNLGWLFGPSVSFTDASGEDVAAAASDGHVVYRKEITPSSFRIVGVGEEAQVEISLSAHRALPEGFSVAQHADVYLVSSDSEWLWALREGEYFVRSAMSELPDLPGLVETRAQLRLWEGSLEGPLHVLTVSSDRE
jgi:hypothetical protein